MIAGTWITLAGIVLVVLGWHKIHRAEGLLTDGLYKYIRHPQDMGLFLIMLGWILHFPTLLTLVIFPVLVVAYYWLARKEERELEEVFAGEYRKYKVQTPRFFTCSLSEIGYGLSGLVMLVGGLVVLVTMMGSIRERTSEFGIFRAIGFRRSHLIQIVLLEAAIISAIAGLAGYGTGLGAAKVFTPLFSESLTVTVPFDPVLAGGVLLLALVLGLASSAYPALMAARLDPNEALRSL